MAFAGLLLVMPSSASEDAQEQEYQGYADQEPEVVLAAIVMHFVHLDVWIDK